MKINLDEKILETLLPVTRGEEDIEETANILIIVGLQKSIEDGFKGLNEKRSRKFNEFIHFTMFSERCFKRVKRVKW